MNKTTLLLCCLLSFCVLSLSATAAHALRCGHVLVSVGDRKFEVRNKCGDPAAIEERIEYQILGTPDRYFRSHPGYDQAYIPIQVEEWTYNFGPHRFMQLLRFENGVLTQIQNLSWGYQ